MRKLNYLIIPTVITVLLSSCTSTTSLTDPQVKQNESQPVVSEANIKTGKEKTNLVYQGSYTKKFDLLHTKLEVSFDWQNRYLFGKATIQLKPHFYPQQTLVLDAKGFDIHEIKLLDGDRQEVLSYKYDDKKITIDLKKEIYRTETITVFIKYTAKSYELTVGGSEAILEDRGLYFINHDGSDQHKPQQIWTQGETESNSCWFPTIDAPNQKTTQEIYITVEDRFKTLSNGDLIYSQLNEDETRTDYWRMNQPHAPYLFMMAIGEFAIVSDKWKNIPVDYYVEPEYAQYARDIFGTTPEMLEFFSNKFEFPYPWSKYSQVVVKDYVSGAMENTTASLYMEELLQTKRELIDDNNEDIIAHELMHQWFGDLVTCESWSNLTLNEGFASYAEYLWKEFKKEKKDAEYKLYEELNTYFSQARNNELDLIRFYYNDKEDMFDDHSYSKGGLVLHMLREYVGDDAFFTSLHNYLTRYQYQSVEVHDLRLVFEETTGEDLNWFFNQWFLAKGHPQLEIKHQYVDSTRSFIVEVYQKQNIDEQPIYKIPLDISFFTESGIRNEILWVTNVADTFSFAFDKEPKLFLPNSEEDLVIEILHEKSLNEWIVQSELAKNVVSRYKAYVELANDTSSNLIDVMHKGLFDEFEEIKILVMDYARQSGDSIVKIWEEDFVNLANSSTNSEVRSEALFTLFEVFGEKHIDLYNKAINDSSYLVAGSGLYAVLQLSANEEVNQKLIDQFINEHNVNVVLPLASYFMISGDTARFNWFKNQIVKGKSEVQYYLLRMVGQYMMVQGEESIEAGIELLSEYALNDSKYYIRIAALQSLQLFEENQLAREKLEQIVLNEKDERVRRFLN